MYGTRLLPFQAVGRKTIALPLRQCIGADHIARVVHMATRARHVEQTTALVVEGLAFLEEGLGVAVDFDIHWHATRLITDIGGHGEHFR